MENASRIVLLRTILEGTVCMLVIGGLTAGLFLNKVSSEVYTTTATLVAFKFWQILGVGNGKREDAANGDRGRRDNPRDR